MANSSYLAPNLTWIGNSTSYYEGLHLTNGTLWPQLNASRDTYNPTSYFYNGHQIHGNVNLTVLPNNLSSLTFLATEDFFPDVQPLALATVALGNDYYRFPVDCMYPLSGSYDVLPRGLFYLLLLVSLVFRRHVLLSSAALATAMTYSATACVHLFALLVAYGWQDIETSNSRTAQPYGEVDLLAIYPVLTAAGSMLAPLLSWSTTIRRHNAQAVIIWWGILIFAGLVPAWLYHIWGFGLDTIPSFAACPRPKEVGSKCDVNNLRKSAADFSVFTSYELYYECGCLDFCSTFSPQAPMRKNTNMVASLSRSIYTKVSFSNDFWYLVSVSYLLIPIILVYGVLGILTSRSSPASVRNSMYMFLSSDRKTWIQALFQGDRRTKYLGKISQENPSLGRRIFRKTRHIVAKLAAAIFYIITMLGAIICPVVFVGSIVANEISVSALPTSEHRDSVGSWGPWVSAVLIVAAAFVRHYSLPIYITFRLALESVWSVFRYSKIERQEFGSSIDKPKETLRSRMQKLKAELHAPFQHSRHSIRRGIRSLRVHFGEFKYWWKNTGEASLLNQKEIKTWQKNKIPKTKCVCLLCQRQRENREKRKNQILQAPYDSNDSDDDLELRTIFEYLQKRVKRRLGPDYHILRNGKHVDAFEEVMNVERPTRYTSPVDPAKLAIYEHLSKRVKRRLGEEYSVARLSNTPSIEMVGVAQLPSSYQGRFSVASSPPVPPSPFERMDIEGKGSTDNLRQADPYYHI